jgi:RNA polymerase sigma-70 factor (ECF subfamily)
LPTSQTQPILRHLRRAVAGPKLGCLSDDQVLARFVTSRDEEAFEALVRRHGPMVLGVCRRVLGDPHEADDAFQATFLVLATKAASVVPAEMLPNWLYGVARQTAVRARALAAKRRRRERQVLHMPEPQAPQADPGDDLRPLLDAELACLPGKYRVAVILCDLEGHSHKDAAGLMGWPVGTLASRHSRGRRMLRERLVRRGIGLPSVAWTAMLSRDAVSACLPPSLVSITVQAGSLGQAAVSLQVAALTEGVLKAMSIKKLMTVAAVLLVVSVVALGGGMLARQAAADEPDGLAPAVKDGKKAAPAARKDRLEVRADGKQVQVRAVWGGEEVVAVADRMSYDDGLLVLEGNVRVQKRRGQEEETIQGQKVVIDRKTAKVSVEGAGGVRMAVPALGPVPVSVDFGFPTVKEGTGEKRPDADLPALRKELEDLREKVKKLEGRSPQAGAGAREFSIAEFYCRNGQPGSAAFYYELVSHRHADTLFGDKAKQRLEEVRQQPGS